VGSANAKSAGEGAREVSPEAAEFAVAHLNELSPDLRGCAVLDGEGRALAASGEPGRWREAALAFLAAADAARQQPADEVHVGIEDGEAFAVRQDGLAMVAVSERFTLASLVLFDMRTILRDLARGGEAVDRRAASRAAGERPADADPAAGGWPAAEEI
jgi:hypothetical protein